jgi:hypothetical protein
MGLVIVTFGALVVMGVAGISSAAADPVVSANADSIIWRPSLDQAGWNFTDMLGVLSL